MNRITNGYDIHYDIYGSGEKTVVVLQGWGTGRGLYETVAKALSDRYRVILFDLPGFGQSTEPREPWGVDEYADFFRDFMKDLGIECATLIGHSFGGRIIIKLAARHMPGFSIERIVLVDSAGIVNKKSFKTKCRIARYKILKHVVSLKAVRFFFEAPIAEWKKKQGSEDYRNASEMMKKCLVKAVNEDLRDLLPEIREETLLIWGDRDTATPLSDGKTMEQMIPDAGLAVIPGTGHFSFLENVPVFTKIINSFL